MKPAITILLFCMLLTGPGLHAQQHFSGVVEYSFTRYSNRNTNALPDTLTAFYQGNYIKLLPGFHQTNDSLWVMMNTRTDTVFFFNGKKKNYHAESAINSRGDFPLITPTDSFKTLLGYSCRGYILRNDGEPDIAGYLWLAEDLTVLNGKDFIHHPMVIYFGGRHVMMSIEVYDNNTLAGVLLPERVTSRDDLPDSVFSYLAYSNSRFPAKPVNRAKTTAEQNGPDADVYIIKEPAVPKKKNKDAARFATPRKKGKKPKNTG